MKFIQNTEEDIARMMKAIGITSISQLFEDIPEGKLLKLDTGEGMSEIELKRSMYELAEQNTRFTGFLGAGMYDHFVPSVVSHLVSRSEFYTAYTPYQAEMSQGILQSIYEYQTLISELCGTDLANASLYDGSTALAEGAFMAANITGRKEILVSSTIHPEYRNVLRTYASARDLDIAEIGFRGGATSLAELDGKISGRTAAVLVQSPNFFGQIEELTKLCQAAHQRGALLVSCVAEPTCLGLLKPPGEYGADIVVGEAQGFGNPVCFGGPALGFLATRKEFVRQIPGRLVGATEDAGGKRGFMLTLQAREQHVRRERATSNICSNEALCALAATVYLVAMGKNLRRLAELNLQKAHFAHDELKRLGFEEVFTGPFYNEFVIKCRDADRLNEGLLQRNMVGGLKLEPYYPQLKNCVLLCVTETASRGDIDRLLEAMGELA